MEQIEQFIDEMYDNTRQFPRELNELPTKSENNQDNIMLQDIVTKNEIATDNSMKLIETLLTEISEDASTQSGGLTLSEGNQDNLILQDIISKNEIATYNSIKLIEHH